MPSQEQLRKRELWKLYGETRKMEADGLDYQTISRFVARQTAEWEEKVPGYQSLLNKLGIEDNPGERSARAAVQGFASNVAQGATLGGADELAGVIGGAASAAAGGGFQEGYREQRDRIRDRAERFAQENPKTAIGAEIGGALVPGILTGGIAAGAAGSGSLLSQVVQGGLTLGGLGAAEGAAYGALGAEGEGLADRAAGGAVGGAIGGATAGLLGAGAPVAGALSRQALRAGEAVGIPGAQQARRAWARRIAERELREAMGAMDMAPAEIAAAVEAMPEGSIVADFAESFARKAKAARNAADELDRPGGPVEAVRAREMGKGPRAAESLRGGTGLQRVENPEKLLEAGVEAWRDSYETPFLAGLDGMTFGSTRIRKLLKDNEFLSEALGMVRANVDEIRQTQRIKVEDGWAAIQRMDKLLKSGKLDVKEFRRTKEAQVALKEEMERLVPGFTEMRAQYRGVIARAEGYDAGFKLFGKHSRTIRSAIENAESPQQAQAIREGLMDAWEQKFQMVPGTVNRLQGGAKNEMMAQLRHLFPEGSAGDMRFLHFVDDMANEGRWARTYEYLKGGPRTAQELGDAETLGGVVTRMPSLVNEVLSIFVTDPTMRREVGRELGEILLTDGPEAMIRAAVNAERQFAAATAANAAALTATNQAAQAAPGLLSEPNTEDRGEAGILRPNEALQGAQDKILRRYTP
jgi:hypothetical protein